jgi:DNA-binding beta-propeller fold protein YncE
VDAGGNVYVAGVGPIQEFTSTGTYITQWGTPGSGDGQFSSTPAPHGVAVDASGNVYVADSGNDRIQKFTSTGTYLTQWGTPGTGDGQFNAPLGVAVDASGYVYVADFNNNRMQKFGPASQLSVPGEAPLAFALDPVLPNPARGSALTVRFTLASAAPASLELLDVAGRRISAREVGQLGAGRHELDFGVGRSLAPGLYLVRLKQGTNSGVIRAAVLD